MQCVFGSHVCLSSPGAECGVCLVLPSASTHQVLSAVCVECDTVMCLVLTSASPRQVLSAVCVAHVGLTETELQEAFNIHKQEFSPLYFALEKFIISHSGPIW